MENQTEVQKPDELLIKIANDNESYPFPLESIEEHFTAMVLRRDLFNDIWYAALEKLKNKFSSIVGNAFILISGRYFDSETDLTTLDELEYYKRVDDLYNNLKVVRVSIIQKDSPDGELIKNLHTK
jgi:hypothetical protein